MKTKAHTRYRTKDDTIVPGATTICALLAKPALIAWANKKGLDGVDSAKYTDDLADVGVLAHQLICDDLRGLMPDTRDYSEVQIAKAETSFRMFKQWVAGKEVEPIIVETPLVSERYGYGGQLDLFAEIDEVKTLVDFKTGAIWPEHQIQSSAYKQLLQENGYSVEQVKLLSVPRDGTENFSEMIVSETVLDLNFELFCHLLQIYNIRRQLK